MTYPNHTDLQHVNDDINALPYESDAERYNQPDFWDRADGLGNDCEDFALAKLNYLADLGWPAHTLRLACCYVETGEYHAVLVAQTEDGPRILDNRQNHPCTLAELHRIGYRPDRIQKEGGSRSWAAWSWTTEGEKV